MIDVAARNELSQNLRRLVTGRMTNDEFDELVYHPACDSPDGAVRRIAEFGYCLYSSDVIWPYRLKGCHAVSSETRRVAARCVLLLRSALEYEWPPEPDNPTARELQGLAMFLGLPLGIALLLICLPVLFTNAWPEMIGWIFLAALAVLAFSLWMLVVHPCRARNSARWQAFFQSGDYEVWPFLRRSDFDHARGRRGDASS